MDYFILTEINVTANISIPLVILQLLATIVMILILAKFAWKPYQEYVNNRNEKINDNISSAKDLKKDAQKLEEIKKLELEEFKEEKNKLLNYAKTDANNQKEEIISTAKKQAISIEKRSLNLINTEKETAKKEIELELLDLVNLTASKFISEKINDEEELNMFKTAVNKVSANEWI